MPSRRRDRPVRHLTWRVRIFAAGAVLALWGMSRGIEWLVNLAIGVLLVGFLLRFLPEADEDRTDADEDRADADEDRADADQD
jgi:hypothetical protein